MLKTKYPDVLSNIDIDLIAKQLKLKNYRGTFSKDQIPSLNYRENDWSILNLQDAAIGNGTHWIAFVVKNNKILFFDSYGIYPPEIIKKIQRDSDADEILYQYERLQQNSKLCGWFCLYFIQWVQDGNDFQKINPETFSEKEILKFKESI